MPEQISIGHMTCVADAKRLLINLTSVAKQKPHVRSCEIVDGLVHSVASPGGIETVHDVFVQPVADAVEACVAMLALKSQVIALPTFAVETDGLVLSNVYVVSSDKHNGSVDIILRFGMFSGSLSSAFRPDAGLDFVVRERLATAADRLPGRTDDADDNIDTTLKVNA